MVRKMACQYIPRGCQNLYIRGIKKEDRDTLRRYHDAFQKDPFSEETVALGSQLLSSVTEARRKAWAEMIENTDVTRNSKKAWSFIKKLSADPPPTSCASVTPDQVASVLVKNGKPEAPIQKKPVVNALKKMMASCSKEFNDFSTEEVANAIKSLKTGKACGPDGIMNELIKHFGSVAVAWLTAFFDKCLDGVIPKIWRTARVVALPKPKKDHSKPENYRPISLLCHLFKLYERLLVKRLTPMIDGALPEQQAGFREKRSCLDQVANLVEHIEGGFQQRDQRSCICWPHGCIRYCPALGFAIQTNLPHGVPSPCERHPWDPLQQTLSSIHE